MTDTPKKPKLFIDRWHKFKTSSPQNKPITFAVGFCVGFILLLILGSNGAFDRLITPLGHSFYGNQSPARVGFVFCSAIAGFTLGWFLSPKAIFLRMLICGAITSAMVIVIFKDHGPLGWAVASILAAILFMAGFGYWSRGVVERFRASPTTFGDGKMSDENDMRERNLLDGDGLKLGHFEENGKRYEITYNGDRHGVLAAPSRSGKGTSFIIPLLLSYTGAMLVTDPKSENVIISAKQRLKMGHEVHGLAPWGVPGMNVSCFNPMDWLQSGDVDISDNAMILVDAIIINSGGEEQFWTEEAKALLLGVMLFVALDKSFEGKRNLGTVRDLLTLDELEMVKMFKRMLTSTNRVVQSTGARCLQKDEKLLSNVLASVQAQTHFLDSPRIRESLSRSDFKFEDLKTKKISIFLVLPSDRVATYGRWLRLLIQQAITVNARNIEIQPEKPVLFILDEMPALGRLPMVEQAYGLMAGYGIQIISVIQNLSQLKAIYGDAWETFISNSGFIAYYGSRDNMTAEYFSRLCGVTSVWNFSTAVSRAFGVTHGSKGSNSTTNTNTETANCTQRKLIYPDQLARIAKNRQLILVENGNPIIAEKQPWFENPDLKDLGVNLHDKSK